MPSIKWMGVTLVIQHIVNAYQDRYVALYYRKEVTSKQLVNKVTVNAYQDRYVALYYRKEVTSKQLVKKVTNRDYAKENVKELSMALSYV